MIISPEPSDLHPPKRRAVVTAAAISPLALLLDRTAEAAVALRDSTTAQQADAAWASYQTLRKLCRDLDVTEIQLFNEEFVAFHANDPDDADPEPLAGGHFG